MEERLQWIKLVPQSWCHWEPVQGGTAVHQALSRRYPGAACFVVEPGAQRSVAAALALRKPWWHPARWNAPAVRFEMPGDGAVDMLWSNMALHMAADPQALLQRWHRALAADGFLMFSCLGPDTLRGVREAWRGAGWPPPTHAFTDMHDWGDMLVNTGFAEPVMDMERITLTFSGPPRAIQELRGLGRNLHVARFGGLRGRQWLSSMGQWLTQADPLASGQVALEFEVIYGHAFKARPRLTVKSETSLSLEEMRHVLQQGRAASGGRV